MLLADSPPDAVLTSISLDTAGTTAAFLADSPAHPAELFTGELGGPISRRTTSNPWLEEVSLARQEVVRYPASDGLEIEGILIYPLDFTQEKRYPLVVIAHGGPESHYHNGWLTRYNRPGQVLAARGFLVLYPNYRGSTGRGVAFSKLGQADAAGAEFTDLVDGADYLVELGLVNPDHVGITGASYGGYATAWCATRFTDRFAAGVMFAGISDKVSKAGTTDIPQEELLVHARALPHEKLELFYERSPIAHAAGSRTPLLIAHGTADTRVHPGQALEMYRALRMAGKAPVRLVLYPGEGHGNRRAASRLDLNLRQIRWLEHYLKGPGGDPPPYPMDHSSPNHGWDETIGNR
jgi:dipeptidyl aminopeptidase/acylaminoacyl peptidase